MKCTVKETNEGNVILCEITEDENFPMVYETLDIHKEIWKDNYLDKTIQVEENFRIIEHELEQDFFQLIALPIITPQIN